jgi:hypothetical protein
MINSLKLGIKIYDIEDTSGCFHIWVRKTQFLNDMLQNASLCKATVVWEREFKYVLP